MTLPDFSATTPKVSLFEFKSMGEELITTSVKQTEKFSKIAVAKVNFMKVNQGGAFPAVRFTPCVVLNATGVRLSLKAYTGQMAYPPPSLIEPGECASFLVPEEVGTITYEVQVFEGPFGGWKAPDTAGVPPKDVSIQPFELKYAAAGSSTMPPGGRALTSTASAFVQDMKNPDKPFETTLTWTTNGQALPVNEFKLTQSVAH